MHSASRPSYGSNLGSLAACGSLEWVRTWFLRYPAEMRVAGSACIKVFQKRGVDGPDKDRAR
jgi:hypothetical protein